jgi:hypothetical protein
MEDRRPVFLLGLHRGGTTFTQRLLNCHHEVLLWGENHGVLSRLRLMQAAFTRMAQRVDAEVYAQFDSHAEVFEPWANPLGGDDLIPLMRSYVESLYRVETPHSVWGFKEVRHGNRADLAFLRRMFPEALLVFLVRHPRELLMSDLHTEWSAAPFQATDKYVDSFISRYARALDAFNHSSDDRPGQCRVWTYEDVRDGGALQEIIAWLGLPLSGLDQRLVSRVRAARVGSSLDDAGRKVSPKEERHVLGEFDARFGPVLASPKWVRAAQELRRRYPDMP